jgi:hypothetical protein
MWNRIYGRELSYENEGTLAEKVANTCMWLVQAASFWFDKNKALLPSASVIVLPLTLVLMQQNRIIHSRGRTLV